MERIIIKKETVEKIKQLFPALMKNLETQGDVLDAVDCYSDMLLKTCYELQKKFEEHEESGIDDVEPRVLLKKIIKLCTFLRLEIKTNRELMCDI